MMVIDPIKVATDMNSEQRLQLVKLSKVDASVHDKSLPILAAEAESEFCLRYIYLTQ